MFCCLYYYIWTYFLPGSSVFIVDFEHLNDRWECCACILTIAILVAISSSESLTRTRLFLTAVFQSIPKRAKTRFGVSPRKMLLRNLAPVNKQTLTCNLLTMLFIVYVLLGINLIFYWNFFHQHLPETYPWSFTHLRLRNLL